mmetsp:Transcript_3942/g.9151  ORF Transcript_3942/g.9151 Transcript_3942/m.9151 type:complete len:220 (+) Transcript_3942:487-1146(+)
MNRSVDGGGIDEPVVVRCRMRFAPKHGENRSGDGSSRLHECLNGGSELRSRPCWLWRCLLHLHQCGLVLRLQRVGDLRPGLLRFLRSRGSGEEGAEVQEPGDVLPIDPLVSHHVGAHASCWLLKAFHLRKATELHQSQIQAFGHSMLQERAGEGFPQHLSTAAGHAQVANTCDEAHPWAGSLHLGHGVDEVLRRRPNSVRAQRRDETVKDDVLCREVQL